MSSTGEQCSSQSEEDKNDCSSSSDESRKESDSETCDGQQLEEHTSVSIAGVNARERGECSSSISGEDLKAKKEERLKRLRDLHLRRNEARKLNHAEVIEEDKRNKLPSNWEAKKRSAEWQLAEDEAKKQAELAGEDYERLKRLDMSAAELEGREKRLRKKKNPDPGFSDFAQLQQRQYERLTKQMEPDMTEYEKQKQKMGADFYPSVNTLLHGGKGRATEAGMDRMVADLDRQIEKRGKYSRKRTSNNDADVDYINNKNMVFNKKVSRFYDKYTAEIKQNLERGTAI